MLLVCGKQSNTLTPQMLSAVFAQLVGVIESETDSSFLASLYKCFTDAVRVVGGPNTLTPDFRNGIVAATRNQLQLMADKRKARAQRAQAELDEDREDMALLEELEDFALEDMAKLLQYLEPNHPLLVAVGSVKDLGIRSDDWDDDVEGDDS